MRNKSFASKIWVVLIIGFFVLAVSIYGLFNYYYRNQLVSNLKTQYEYENQFRYKNAENYVSTANSCINTIIVQLNAALDETDLDEERYPLMLQTATQKKIYTCLLNSFKMFEDSIEVAILWDNGVCFVQKDSYLMYSGQSALVEELDSIGISRKGTWLTSISSELSFGNDGLYCVKPYVDMKTGQEVGYVILEVRSFAEAFDQDYTNGLVYLFSSDGLLLECNDEVANESLSASELYKDQIEASQLVYSALISEPEDRNVYRSILEFNNGWSLVCITPLNEDMLLTLDQTIKLMLFLLSVILILIFGLIGACIVQVTRPIRQLSEHMSAVQNKLPEPFTLPHVNNEIGVLIDSYNQMIYRNNDLVTQLVESKHLQDELELSLLQAQIKPHFLYNVLDAIYCLNAIGRYPDASRMTKLLSEYYRLTLNNGVEWIDLEEEMRLTNIYLEIQTVRFARILSYDITYDPALKGMRIPKLILQPLVENAIDHGIKPLNRPGHILVTAQRTTKHIEIRIQDDGVGFLKEHFDRLLNNRKYPDHGYGLYNVFQRLYLYYGKECRMTLEPVSVGTCILICIPIKDQESE